MTHDGKWTKAASFAQTYRNTLKYIILEIPLLILRLYDSFESQSIAEVDQPTFLLHFIDKEIGALRDEMIGIDYPHREPSYWQTTPPSET